MNEHHPPSIELYRARNLFEADLLVSQLAERDIPANLINASIQGALGELPLGWMAAPRVMVRPRDEPAAQMVLAEFLQRATDEDSRRPEDETCLACSSVMAEHTECPECGWSWGPSDEADCDGADEIQATVAESMEALDSTLTREEASSARREIGLFLAVGFLPLLVLTVFDVVRSAPEPVSYVARSLMGIGVSGLTIVAALTAMHRSRLRWHEYGLSRPQLGDAVAGVILTSVFSSLHFVLTEIFPDWDYNYADVYALPQDNGGYILMVLTALSFGIAFELGMRAYLVTRLAGLTGSPVNAVMISSALCAALDLINGPALTAHTFVMALSYAICFYALRRIWPFIVATTAWSIYVEMTWVWFS